MMRTAEWVNLVSLLFFIVLAWLGPRERRARIGVTAIGCAGLAAILTTRLLQAILARGTISAIEDWLPAPLMLVVYWQVGQFRSSPNEKLQAALARLDDRVLAPVFWHPAGQRIHEWIAGCLEFAYLFCYFLVPLGVGVLYVAHLRDYADEYWAIVLPSTYLCYILLPFAQTMPPRMLEPDGYLGPRPGKIRALNLWLLQRASIQVNTFPSAHVASTFAASLALAHVAPLAGLVFLCVAIGIALGAVLGRYHYAADALLGALLATAVFLLEIFFGSW